MTAAEMSRSHIRRGSVFEIGKVQFQVVDLEPDGFADAAFVVAERWRR